MELDEVIRRRRMCRSFLDRPVDPAIVDRLLDRARRAPSAGHTQGWAWLVLEGAVQTRRFWELDAEPAWLARPSHPGLLRAPVILLPLANPSAYERRYAEPDKAGRGRPGGALGADRRSAGIRPDPGRRELLVPPGQPAASGDPSPPGGPVDWPVPWWDVDLSFGVMSVLLGAVEEGLGALLFALHGEPETFKDAFGVPREWRLLGAVALGWPGPDETRPVSAGRGRRPWDEVVHRARW